VSVLVVGVDFAVSFVAFAAPRPILAGLATPEGDGEVDSAAEAGEFH
jgi:hypothetical protein